MSTVSVFRIEHTKLKFGPWMSVDKHDLTDFNNLSEAEKDSLYEARKALDTHWTNNLERYPNPWNDPKIYTAFNETFFCGVRTLADLCRWFRKDSPYIDALFDAGYTVREYVVPVDAAIDGKTQVVFDRAKAIEEIDHSMLALFEA